MDWDGVLKRAAGRVLVQDVLNHGKPQGTRHQRMAGGGLAKCKTAQHDVWQEIITEVDARVARVKDRLGKEGNSKDGTEDDEGGKEG